MNPNVFIIGVAKSGTTAVFENLKNSPEIYFPHIKEPKYLSSGAAHFPFGGPGDDKVEARIVKDRVEYLKLFEGANTRYACDASVDSFYYADEAISRIRELCSAPKVILILRNPYERMFSAYRHLTRDERETLNFEEALAVEETRIGRNYEFLWHYLNGSLYADRLAKFKEAFPDMLVLLKDELDESPEDFYLRICNYLDIGVPRISKVAFNVSGVPKNTFVHSFLNHTDNRFFLFAKRVVRALVGKRLTYIWKSRINASNLIKEQNDSWSFDLVKERVNDDIIRTSALIDRSLVDWLR